MDSPFCDAMNPAEGKTAKVGSGGMIVSSKAARNIPSYRYLPKISLIHDIADSYGSNQHEGILVCP